MRKLLTILLTALAVALVLVGCSMETKVEDGLALLSFNVNENNLTSRSLTRTNPQLKESDFYWYYTAEKIDNIGLETGETTGQVAVQAGVKGLEDVTIGPFSYGLWKFTVYGYAAYDGASGPSNLVYEGSSTLTVNMKSNTLEVTVASKSSGANGTLEFPALGEIAITGTKVSFDATNFVEKIYVKGMDAANSTVEKTVYNSTERSFSLASGNYSVTVSYLSGATSDNNGTYSGGMTVATDTIYVTIADYLTTKVAGTIQENTGSVVVEVSSGVFSATSEVVELKDNEESLAIPVAAAPAKKASSSSSQSGDGQTGGDAGGTQGSETTPAVEAKTTVTVPTSLVEGNVTKASVAVTSYSQEAAASTMPTYTIEGTEEEGSTTLVPLGGLDIDLYVNGSESKTTDFAENQTLTISTVVATGLNGGVSYDKQTAGENKCSIIVKYNGTGGEDGEVVSYNAATGELTFTVSHLSTYYFVDKDAKVYNQSKNTTYKDLDAAISAATDGDTILLLDCSLSNKVKDEDVSRFNWQVTHNNCSAEAEGYWHEKKSDFYSGYGTKLEPYLIASKEQFKKISDNNDKYAYYKINPDYTDTDLSNWTSVNLHGSFDGSNKHFTNVTSGLFDYVGKKNTSEEITLKNIEATFAGAGDGIIYCLCNTGTTTFDNVKVHGTLEGYWNFGSFISYGYLNSFTAKFINSTSDATLNCIDSTVGGFVGNAWEGSGNTFTLIIDDNSKFTGTICSTKGQGHMYVGMTSNYGYTLYKGTVVEKVVGYKAYDNVKKITEVKPELNENGYTIAVDSNAFKLVYSVDARLDGYESDNVTTTANRSGITMVLDMNEVTTPISDTVLLEKVTSATIKNGADDYDYTLTNGAMEVCVPGNYNYRSGTIRLTVTQYDSKGGIICTGTTDVFKITNSTDN